MAEEEMSRKDKLRQQLKLVKRLHKRKMRAAQQCKQDQMRTLHLVHQIRELLSQVEENIFGDLTDTEEEEEEEEKGEHQTKPRSDEEKGED